ncbi:MAG: proton-conducting transporter membrane subunit [Segetibacter sp.]
MAVLCSWNEIKQRVGFYYFNLLWTLAGISGVFIALDLFLFYFFWEVMLVPMFFLIGIWGDSNRRYAAYKFFIFTQVGGLLMLISILALYFIHGAQTGIYSYDYFDLLKTRLDSVRRCNNHVRFSDSFLYQVTYDPISQLVT